MTIKEMLIVLAGMTLILLLVSAREKYITPRKTNMHIKSIDTMKYSRDLARELETDSRTDEIIENQIIEIAMTGATHVALGTPYDHEFIPYLEKWVNAARKYKLNVWFRGNFSGWEGWFGYPLINNEEHKEKLKSFLVNNQHLFADGDVFTSCPECENGSIGDPRKTKKVQQFRSFLIDEYTISTEIFKRNNKQVDAGYYSMNFDVAKLVMDHETAKATGNVVVIDHYVRSPEQLAKDARMLSKKTGSKIVIGETGVPIPSIHGKMSEVDRAVWLEKALVSISNIPEVVGINYWVNKGGSTALWSSSGSALPISVVLTNYYKTPISN